MQHSPTNEFQFLFKALGYLRTHWWLFVLEICVVFGVWLTKFHRTPNVYESQAQILIDSSTRQMYRSVFLPNRRDSRNQNMIHLLRSPEVMEEFRNRLTETFHEQGRPVHLQAFFPGGQALAANRFLHWISLVGNRNSDIFNIRCTARNPDAAYELCKSYLDTLQEAYPKFGQRGIQNKRDFLSRQVSSLQRQVIEREKAIAEFEKEHSEYVSFKLAVISSNSLQSLRSQMRQMRSKMKLNRSIRNLLLNHKDLNGSRLVSHARAVTELKGQLTELHYREHLTEQTEDQEKESRLTKIREEIADVEAQLTDLNARRLDSFRDSSITEERRQSWIDDLNVQYQVNNIKLANLSEEIRDIEAEAERYREVDLRYNRIKSELGHKNRMLANLYRREQETEIELSAVRTEVFKLAQPSRSGHRIQPQLSKHIFAALSISVFVLLISALLLAILFPRLDNEAEVHRLNIPILGKIPIFRDLMQRGPNVSAFSLEYLKIMSYRILRETKAKKCPIIIVSSPQAGEGKSTVTYFLTQASQSPGRKCLFVDGDLITSHPNVFFGHSENASGGLKEILEPTEGQDSKVDIKSLIVPTEKDGIYFLPRGGKVESISAPNFLQPIRAALEELKEEYDLIYIDTPPLFTSSLAHQWCGVGDLVVLVARMFLTRPKDLVEALQTCKIFTRAPVGVALNCLPMFQGPGRGSYYYYFSRQSTGKKPKNRYLSVSK